MAVFKYTGRSKKGVVKRGTIEATSRNDAIRKLRQEGISPREVEETKPSIFNRDISFGGSKVKAEDFIIYCRQFATLIRAGISIVESTNILAEQTESKALQKVLRQVEQDVSAGMPFSEAAAKHPKAFPPLFGNMIRAGEMTGNLDETLERMADYFEKQHSLKKKIQSTLSYPGVLTVLIIGVVIFMLVYIIPQFTEIYDSLGGELPAMTKMILAMSEFMQKMWWLILLVVGGVIFAFFYTYKHNRHFNYTVNVMILKMPIFGKLLQKAAIARMTRTLSSLFASAVPILQALEIVAKVAENPVISKVVLEARESLEAGGTLSEPLAAHWVFPPIVHQMVAIGEQTGSLDYMLEKIADFYEEDVDRTVDTLQSMIEPLMIVLLAVVVGFIVAAIMIPMFTMFTEIS